jgi:hypothetical protein
MESTSFSKETTSATALTFALSSFPIKRRYPPNDDFFTLGNLEARTSWLLKHNLFKDEVEEIMHQAKLYFTKK